MIVCVDVVLYMYNYAHTYIYIYIFRTKPLGWSLINMVHGAKPVPTPAEIIEETVVFGAVATHG